MPRDITIAGFFDELMKIAAYSNDSSYLTKNVGKPKTRALSSASSISMATSPDPKYRVKSAMIPVGKPMVNPGAPQSRLFTAQRVGTPDDPKGPDYRPLNTVQPKPIKPIGVPKLGYAMSYYSGPLGYPGVPQVSGIPAMRVSPVGAPDPQLKEGGGKTPTKPAVDKKRKDGEKHAAVPLSPRGRLASSRKEGKPKMTGFSGPSIADVSKPIGFGLKIPGATKNRI